MPEPLAHVYDLALRALDEQERRVAQLHARITPVLAAGGVGITLLTGPAFGGPHPIGFAGTAAAVLGVAGIAVAAAAATYLLLAARLSFGLDARLTSEIVQRSPVTDLGGFYTTVTVALDELRLANQPGIERLQGAFTVMLCGMLVSVCGLAAAAAIT